MSTEVLSARGRLGYAKKSGDIPAIIDAQRDLKAAKIAAYIERAVSDAPPLTQAQRDRLTRLLSGGGAA